MNSKIKGFSVKKITLLALFTAIIVVLQFLGAAIRFGMFSISLVCVPIVLGAAVCGPLAGGWLGLVFGIVVLISGDAGAFLAVNPFGAIVTVLVKGTAAGFAAGFIYKLVEGKPKSMSCPHCGESITLPNTRRYPAVIAAAVACPVVNTGIFLLGCLLFFMGTITGWAESFGYGSAGEYMILGLAGGNFIFELLLNMVLSPVILRLINYKKKS